MTPPERRRDSSSRGRPSGARTSGSRSHAASMGAHRGQQVSAAVVLAFILASTAISLFDLHLIIEFLKR